MSTLSHASCAGELTNGRLEFITGSDPDFDPRLLEVSDCFWDAVLESILNGSRAKEHQFALDLFANLVDTFLAILE